jgi:hypothetical protein
MFGTVIKNTLLFVLIILIIHFMINNLLIDLDLNGFGINGSVPDFNKNGKNELNGENGEQVVVKDGGEVEEVNGEVKAVNSVNGNNTLELALPKPERDEKKDEDALKMKELYNYVYEKDADKNLSKLFENPIDIDKNNSVDLQVKCGDSLCSNVNNYCNTSLPIKQEIQGHYSNFNKVQCSKDLEGEEAKHFYIVKNYKNENAMNGGNIDESGIEAFDSLNDCFGTL